METISIEVKPEVAHRWRKVAEREGRAVENLIAEAAVGLETLENKSRERAPHRKATGFGKFTHLNVSSENVTRSRRDEVELEEAKSARRMGTA